MTQHDDKKNIYYKIKEQRDRLLCPVDIMGCSSIPSFVNDRRMYVLCALMLSSQTKDEITYQSMLSLIDSDESDGRYMEYRVRYSCHFNEPRHDASSPIIHELINDPPQSSQTEESLIKELLAVTEAKSKKYKPDLSNINKYKMLNYLVVDINGKKFKIKHANEFDDIVSNMVKNTDLSPVKISESSHAFVDNCISQSGFHRTKASNLINMGKHICDHGYPETLKEAGCISGFGPKMSILYLQCFGECYGISVDTHVHRISNRIGLVDTRTVAETAKKLEMLFHSDEWVDVNKVLVGFGQLVCTAKKPLCNICAIRELCKSCAW